MLLLSRLCHQMYNHASLPSLTEDTATGIVLSRDGAVADCLHKAQNQLSPFIKPTDVLFRVS